MGATEPADVEVASRHPWLVPAAAGLCGAVAMIQALGPSIVHPTNIDWLMRGDFSLHFLGWHLYRSGPWTLPIGATPLLIWPVGSSVGLTDSIPIASILFKALDPLLPPAFQFIGLWLVASVALQGVFGALLMRIATPRPALQMLGAAMLILSPPLIYRIGHAALTAHWLVLAALWLSLGENADTPSHARALAWALLAALAAAIQPYLLLMVAVIMLAAHVRQGMAAPRRLAIIAAHLTVAVAAAWVALWQAGSFVVPSDDGLTMGGFGAYSSNLLSFVMPTEGRSLLSPGPIPYADRLQYEGYAYMGAGTLLLGLVVVAGIVTPPWRSIRAHIPLALGLLLLMAMALGPAVTAGSWTLVTYDPAWWGPLTIFRTSGRMIWAIYYGLVVAILFAAARFRYRTALALLAGALLVQAIDLAGMSRFVSEVGIYGFRDPLASRFWKEVPPHYERLVLVPSNLCDRQGFVDYLPFSLLAGRHGLAINAGATARYDVRQAASYCEALDREVRDGLGAAGTLYIVRRDLLARVSRPTTGSRPMCTTVDGFGVCFAPGSDVRWRERFEIPRGKLPPAEDFVRFYQTLDQAYRKALSRPAREVPSTAPIRVESIARYLANRLEGCTHGEAVSRTLAGVAADGPCSVVSTQPALPPADQTYAFVVQLSSALAARAGVPTSTTHVDAEGEAVWLQAYTARRLQGHGAREAEKAVLEQVLGSRQ